MNLEGAKIAKERIRKTLFLASFAPCMLSLNEECVLVQTPASAAAQQRKRRPGGDRLRLGAIDAVAKQDPARSCLSRTVAGAVGPQGCQARICKSGRKTCLMPCLEWIQVS